MGNQNNKNFQIDWRLIIAITALLLSFFVFLYGSGQCYQNNPPHWIVPILAKVCPNTPASPTVSPPASGSSNTQIPGSFIATSPLIINGISYSVPTSSDPQGCVSSQQTGTSSGVDYDLVVPKGWFIVWDSSRAYWPGGSYENNGLLQVYGNWQGKVTIFNGGYCAVPVEWEIFAKYERVNASPQASRPQFSIGEVH